MLNNIRKAYSYYSNLIYFRLLCFFQKKKNSQSLNLIEFIEKINIYDKIIIIASGPSSLKLEPKKENLHIATNSSFKLVQGLPLLYVISDNHFVTKYISNRIKIKNLVGILFRFNTGDTGHYNIFKKVEKYLSISNQKAPEILISNFQSSMSDIAGFEELEDWIKSHFAMPFKQQNSGMLILLIGYFIAFKLKKDIEIYGLDAGVGGKKHFDNKGIVGDSVFKDRVKVNLKKYLDKMYAQNKISVKNYSYFNPNI